MADAPPSDPLRGTVLEGRFRLDRLLGEGGMGVIYIAEELRLQRRCAVKLLNPELGADPVYAERFRREAQAIAALQHDNVIDVYHLGEGPDGLLFFAMELLVGEDLETRIDGRGARPYTWVDCCHWAIAVARGTAAVHHAGLVHRDLKPSNVFLARQRDGREVVKLLDFGIARVQGSGDLTAVGAQLGSPNYMSPEQVLARPLDGRTDIYSLGVLLFELLTGELPFHGGAVEVAMQHCNAAPPRPGQLAPEYEIPAALDEVVLTAMAKDPAQRFATMEDFEAALTALLPATAPRVSASPLRPATPLYPSTPGPSTLTAADSPDDADVTRTFLSPRRARGPGRRRVAVLGVLAAALGGLAVLPFLPPPGPPASAQGPTIGPAVVPATSVPVAPGEPAEVKPIPAPEPLIPRTQPRGPREAKAVDPRRELERKAQACRRKHDATAAPPMTIDYAVRSDGTVSRASAPNSSPLAGCLIEATKSTRFPPRLALGQSIAL
jgi:serine/threonine-protein kinase